MATYEQCASPIPKWESKNYNKSNKGASNHQLHKRENVSIKAQALRVRALTIPQLIRHHCIPDGIGLTILVPTIEQLSKSIRRNSRHQNMIKIQGMEVSTVVSTKN